MSTVVIDSHMHCGIQNVNLPFEEIKGYQRKGGIEGCASLHLLKISITGMMITFRIHHPGSHAVRWPNQYLLDLQQLQQNVFAYYFVWNDFKKEELKKGYRGIKWHHHECEPVYHYDDPRCESFLQEAYRLQLPIPA